MGYKHQSYDMGLAADVRSGEIAKALRVTKEYESFDDWPWFVLYERLAKTYPNARFILIARKDTEAYVNSLRRHRERQGCFEPDFEEPAWWQKVFGYAPSFWDEDKLSREYEEHNAAVEQLFAESPETSGRLKIRCWEHWDDWTPLCEFLQVAKPTAPFPHAHKGK